MTRSIILAALLATGSPALARHDGHILEGPRFREARPFVYLGSDDRWGPRVFSRDDGYFQGRGGGVSIAGGKAMFDYDRDYPYDFPARWGAQNDAHDAHAGGSMSHKSCIDEPVRDGRSGQSTTVRICR